MIRPLVSSTRRHFGWRFDQFWNGRHANPLPTPQTELAWLIAVTRHLAGAPQ